MTSEPLNYGFPYVPYSIQLDLMRHVFDALEERRIAIVESPTGTGKSLSLICSTLSWIKHNAHRINENALQTIHEQLKVEMTGEPDWVIQGEIQRRRKELFEHEEQLQERLARVRAQEAARSKARHVRKRLKTRHDNPPDVENDESFAPEDETPSEDHDDGLSSSTRRLMQKLRKGDDEETEEPPATKIIFASRTHSQLSQFVNEVRKTEFEDIRTVTLSGRANLCINEEIRHKARSNEELNELCLDSQKKGRDKCQFLPSDDNAADLEQFRDRVLAQAMTLEDMEELGKEMKTCPYYGSRKAIRQAQLVTLPYQLLLSSNTRQALDLDVTDQIIVIDEAHALIDTILNTRAVEISSRTLIALTAAFQAYRTRFKSRLKGSNLLHLSQVLAALQGLQTFCLDKENQDGLYTAGDLTFRTKLDQLPVRKICGWIQDGKMAHKVSGLSESQAKRAKPDAPVAVVTASAIYRFQSLLLALAEPDTDGRILLCQQDKQSLLKYALLNPEETFKDLVQDSRAMVLAGGTMAPMSDFALQLFSYAKDRLSFLSCGHIVPPDQLLVRSLGIGPTSKQLQFTFDQRKNNDMIDDLGQALLNMSAVVQGGFVVFLPSYNFLDTATDRWKKTGVWGRLAAKRTMFTEPKSSSETEATLRGYAEAQKAKSAMLIAVVGAKLSEGINFSDELCRCVAIVSIPFPSTQSIELKERMRYLSELSKSNASSADAGKAYYSTLAFRAVNQAIGRAIRHRGDWSAIVLIDARYSRPTSVKMLPAWLSGSLQHSSTFGSLLKDLATFMKARKAQIVMAA